MTFRFEDPEEPRRPDPLDDVKAIDMRRVSAARLDRIVAESRSEEERNYHEARWDQIFGT